MQPEEADRFKNTLIINRELRVYVDFLPSTAAPPGWFTQHSIIGLPIVAITDLLLKYGCNPNVTHNTSFCICTHNQHHLRGRACTSGNYTPRVSTENYTSVSSYPAGITMYLYLEEGGTVDQIKEDQRGGGTMNPGKCNAR